VQTRNPDWLNDPDAKKLMNTEQKIILKVCGAPILFVLMNHFGGSFVWFSKEEDGRGKRSEEIIKAVGADTAQRIAKAIGYGLVYVQMFDDVTLPARDKAIEDEFDGSNYRRLANRWGLSEDRIRKILKHKTNELRKSPIPGQLSML